MQFFMDKRHRYDPVLAYPESFENFRILNASPVINVKPLRVWSDDSVYGSIILGFIAQLFISLMRYEFQELKHISTKFIKKT